jgi:hypothetical protein
MNNLRRERGQTKKRGCRRNRKQMGGNLGQTYSLAGSVDPKNPSLGNAAQVVPSSSCQNAVSPGYLQDNGTRGGLPGFGKLIGGRRSSSNALATALMQMPKVGGRRSSSDALSAALMQIPKVGGRRSSSDPMGELMKMAKVGGRRRQMGGVYAPGFEVVGASKIAFMPTVYTGCGEGAFATPNPLHVPDSRIVGITAPPPLKGGAATQLGTAAVDAMVYEAPRSGYTTVPSIGSGNAGSLADGQTPYLVRVPYTAQPAASPACLKTGGSRKKRNSRKSRKSRRNRK